MAKEDQARLRYCSPKPKIEARPLLDFEQAGEPGGHFLGPGQQDASEAFTCSH